MLENDVAQKVPFGLYRIARDPQRTTDLHHLLRDFGHQMRNRLNSLKLGLYLGRKMDEDEGGRLDDWAQVEGHYLALERLFEQYQAVWQPMRILPIQLCLGLFLREKVERWRPGFRSKGAGLALVTPDRPPIARFDSSQFGSALDRFARWRAGSQGQGGTVRVVLGGDRDHAQIAWDESSSGTCCDGDGPASWVALAMLARVVTGHGGTIDLDLDPYFHLRLRWPIEVEPREPTYGFRAGKGGAVASARPSIAGPVTAP